VLPVHVAVGAIADGNGAFDGAYVGDRVGTVVSAVVMEMIEAKMMTGTADFMLSDNVMLLLVVKDCSNLTHQLIIHHRRACRASRWRSSTIWRLACRD
jgi:hypothetical protein